MHRQPDALRSDERGLALPAIEPELVAPPRDSGSAPREVVRSERWWGCGITMNNRVAPRAARTAAMGSTPRTSWMSAILDSACAGSGRNRSAW
jgi:hypothetical protein